MAEWVETNRCACPWDLKLHFPLSSSDRQVGVLNPVVVAQSAGPVEMLAAQNFHRRP